MKTHALASLALLLAAGCATVANPEMENQADSATIQPAGSVIALGQSVIAGDVVLTPLAVTEDSRCPINARCIWAGEAKVRTQVEGRGFSEVVEFTLGEPQSVEGRILNLVSVEPGQMAGGPDILPEQYRVAYEGWTRERPPE